MNLLKKNMVFAPIAFALLAVPGLADWSSETAVGILSGTLWTPARGADGHITAASVAALPVDTWVQVAGTKADDQIEPLLVSGGYKPVGLAASMFIYSGMAFDPVAGKSYQTGGGHSGGGDNGIYSVDFYKMAWGVCTWPSKPGVDLTVEEANMYIGGSQGGNSYAPVVTTNPVDAGGCQVYPYAKSSTGFAVKNWNSESVWAWCEATGPAGRRNGGEAIFPGGLVHGTQAAADYYTAHYHLGRESNRGQPTENDVLPDGRPTSRHQYCGLIYNPARKEVQSVVRSFTRSRTDGSGWVNYDSSGYLSYPANRVHTEMTWTAADDSTGEIWTGGCGSECYVTSYYYYHCALIYNPATGEVQDSPRMNRFEWYDPNCQVYWSWLSVMQNGNWLIGGSGDTTRPWGMFNIRTQERRSVRLTGTPFTSANTEGTPFVFIPELNQAWVFDPNNHLECTAVDFSALTPNTIYPPDTYDAPAFKKTLANASAITLSNGLLYNRLRYWDREKMLVFVASNDQNIWICRLNQSGMAGQNRLPGNAGVTIDLAASPNPFHAATRISYRLDGASPATLTVFDLKGARVRQFSLADRSGGLNWDGRNAAGSSMPSATYLLHLKSGNKELSRRLLLLK